MTAFKDIQDTHDSMGMMFDIANALAYGSWTPALIVRAYLTYGRRYGWSMAQTMENLHVMQGGKLAYQVHAFIGLVLSSGKADRIDTVESTDRVCTIECKRRDSKSVHKVTFTIEMAQAMGLTKSPNWQKMPKQMLQARCRTMALREVFADVISGYDAVEMIDSAWDMSEEEKLKAMDEVQDTAIAESVAHEKMKADRKPGTKKAGMDVSQMPQPMPVQQVQQVQAPTSQPQPTPMQAPQPQPQPTPMQAPQPQPQPTPMQAPQPTPQPTPQSQDQSLFPSEMKAAIGFKQPPIVIEIEEEEDDFDQDDHDDWLETLGIKKT